MAYDQAQSPRLGQRTSVESTQVQIFDVDPSTPTPDLIEAAWPGMMVYRADAKVLQIWDAFHQPQATWLEIGSGNYTYVQSTMPEGTSYKTGDTWYDTDHNYQLYIWDESVSAWVVAAERELAAQVLTSEVLVPGDLVNVYNAGGVARVRKACAATAMRAHGYVINAYVEGESAKVYQGGTNFYQTGLTAGMQWLSMTPGKASAAPAQVVNSMVQQVGYAADAGVLEFIPLIGIKIV